MHFFWLVRFRTTYSPESTVELCFLPSLWSEQLAVHAHCFFLSVTLFPFLCSHYSKSSWGHFFYNFIRQSYAYCNWPVLRKQSPQWQIWLCFTLVPQYLVNPLLSIHVYFFFHFTVSLYLSVNLPMNNINVSGYNMTKKVKSELVLNAGRCVFSWIVLAEIQPAFKRFGKFIFCTSSQE